MIRSWVFLVSLPRCTIYYYTLLPINLLIIVREIKFGTFSLSARIGTAFVFYDAIQQQYGDIENLCKILQDFTYY